MFVNPYLREFDLLCAVGRRLSIWFGGGLCDGFSRINIGCYCSIYGWENGKYTDY